MSQVVKAQDLKVNTVYEGECGRDMVVVSASERHESEGPGQGYFVAAHDLLDWETTEVFHHASGSDEFRVVDAILTNFHLPESSLLMLVAAFAGHETTMRAYRHAVAGRYRFFSYGDAMLITSKARA